MSYEDKGAHASVVESCRYGASRLSCRGPLRDPAQGYVAFLGGSETYGKFVKQPFPDLVEQVLARDCVNLGCVNAGLDAYLQDRDILKMARGADLAVIQIVGAQNLGNPFYRVHPRRNDRFLTATPRLVGLYPEVDFTEFHFNKHLLVTLAERSPERFSQVREGLQSSWVGRMRRLLSRISVPVLLLWLRYDADGTEQTTAQLGRKPLLVGRDMIEALDAPLVEIPVGSAAQMDELRQMSCAPFQTPAAGRLIGPAMHRIVADRLAHELRARG